MTDLEDRGTKEMQSVYFMLLSQNITEGTEETHIKSILTICLGPRIRSATSENKQ